MSSSLRAMPYGALWDGAFRPLFLAAGVWAAFAMVPWLLMLDGLLALPTRFTPLDWHVHEMLFGFVTAAIAGFLLTAIPNWTSRPPVAGWKLAILLVLWAMGRMASATSLLMPGWLACMLDLAFPVMLAAIVMRELGVAGNRRNYPLLLPIGMLSVANLLMHLDALSVAVPVGIGWRMGLACVLMLMAVIGGRIVPAFTRNWLRARPGADGGSGIVPQADRWDSAALVALAIGLALWVTGPAWWVTGVALLLAAVLHAHRLSRWRGWATRHEALLLVLHVGYLWLVLGIAALGASVLTPLVPTPAAIHALTAGAIGTMVLAVMTRATLGHTGRPLHADRGLTLVFCLVGIAAALRIASAWPVEPALLLRGIAGAAWIVAFVWFALRHLPMALAPRVAP